MYLDIATHVFKRATDESNNYDVPAWAFVALSLDLIFFMPFILLVAYTLSNVFPVLAMIEDPSPPAYEPVALNADTDSLADDINAQSMDATALGFQQPLATTASFRATSSTLYSIAGARSFFRGLGCYAAMTFATSLVYAAVSSVPFVPSVFAGLISAVALVQLYTAWLHIVISAPSVQPFWKRMPDFKMAFKATALPLAIYFVALEIEHGVPRFLARVLGMNLYDPGQPTVVPQPDAHDGWKALVVAIAMLFLAVFLTIPAHVVLTRVQASLLPEESETIVPFDRSFQGKLEPAIIGGRGFVTIVDAWNTFSRASWIRLVKLYVKIFLVGMAVYLAFMAVLVPEMVLIFRNAQKKVES